jgi:hypothetical protein
VPDVITAPEITHVDAPVSWMCLVLAESTTVSPQPSFSF